MNETMTTIVGNVITDVTQRRIANGTKVASFRMASNERRFDKEAQEWVNGDSLYVSVTCWRKLAHGVNASLVKGDPVIVTGRLFTRGYEVEGHKRSVTELEAVSVGPDLARCVADVSRAHRQAVEDAAPQIDGEATATGTTATEATATEATATEATATEATVSKGAAAESTPADDAGSAVPGAAQREPGKLSRMRLASVPAQGSEPAPEGAELAVAGSS